MSNKKQLKRIDLNTIKNPDFLKELSYKELDVFCDDVRENIVTNVAKNGGHLSANLGSVESIVALCRKFDFSKDKIIFDVGHQCYTYKILTGRSLERLRKKDGVSGFQKMDESPYDHFECGHSSTSISAAGGMAIARDLNKEKYDVIAYIGDASITNGLAFEGLNNIAGSGHKVIIIFNDNDMSITKPVGGLAKSFRRLSNSSLYRRSKNAYSRIMKTTGFGRWVLGWTGSIKNWLKRHLVSLNLFDNIGLSYIGPVDGHDIKKMEKAFERAKRINKSVVVHIKTIKGKGFKYAENDDYGSWHGVNPFDPKTGKPLSPSEKLSWSELYSDILFEKMVEHKEVFSIVAATGSGSHLTTIFKTFKDRIVDVGISEEHAFTLAGGLSASGYHPVISIYSTFLQRAYDELSHDLARMKLNATVLIDRSGFVGRDGNTHQGIYDESFLVGVPNTVISMAVYENDAKVLMDESLKQHGVFCIRYPKTAVSSVDKKEYQAIKFGGWRNENQIDSNTAIVSVGPETKELMQLLLQSNKQAVVYSAIYLKPILQENIDALLKYQKVIIYDCYATEEGFANYLVAHLIKNNYQGKIIVKAIPSAYIEHASIEEQLEEYHLKPNDIIELI